jgi:hypothetical protein
MADTVELSTAEKAFFDSKGEASPTADVPNPEGAVADPKAPAATEQDHQSAAPEAAKTAGDEEDAQVGGDPRKALHEERERRRAIAKERDEIKTNFTKLQSRIDTLTEIAKTAASPLQPLKAEAPTEIPDINTDPVGHFKALRAQDRAELDQMKAWKVAQERQFEQTNNVQRISQLAQAQESEFKKTTPDYDQASAHLMQQRDAELLAYGISDPMERKNIIAQDAIQIAASALGQNKNPAQVIYEMSKARGYVGKAPAAASPAPGKAPTEAEKVRMAAAGQKAGASLGQLNGAASPPTTLESLASMSDEDFAKATAGGQWRKLMGG